MLSPFRCASRRAASPRWHVLTLQNFISPVSARHDSSLAPEPPSNDITKSYGAVEANVDPSGTSLEATDNVGEESTRPESYAEFMRSIGEVYLHASPRKWLGGEVPFPMNPSFLPPAPISDAVRTQMYQEFMRDPVKNSVRALSQKYHVSLKRVDAILRLKGLENAWLKGKQLQTGFQQGMEKLLGVKDDERMRTAALKQGKGDRTRYDAHEADILEQEENRDAARQRYQRLYWESVPESGGEPVVPVVLEHAKRRARQFATKPEGHMSKFSVMPRIKDTDHIKTPLEKVQIATKPGRPTIEFVDVGGKFLDADECMHRMAIAERRTRVRKDKRLKKEDMARTAS
ncbi:hypothetical protein AX17_000362 [Amanita inopinata Kibby_2008]|nr:hypothetical protein AX17_000362 [Amanita inopinata Kibby_2008]